MAIHLHGVAANRVFLKLDPGESGIPGAAFPASQAPRAVVAQELGNKFQLLRKALAQGRDVDFVSISFSLSAKGAIAGKTEVRTSQRPGELKQLNPKTDANSSPPLPFPNEPLRANGNQSTPPLSQTANSPLPAAPLGAQEGELGGKTPSPNTPKPPLSFLGFSVNAFA